MVRAQNHPLTSLQKDGPQTHEVPGSKLFGCMAVNTPLGSENLLDPKGVSLAFRRLSAQLEAIRVG